MILYIDIQHNEPDYRRIHPITIIGITVDGIEIPITWDESNHSYGDGITSSRCKGIYFNDNNVSNKIVLLKEIVRFETEVDCYDDLPIETARILRMEFEEGDKRIEFNRIAEDGTVM